MAADQRDYRTLVSFSSAFHNIRTERRAAAPQAMWPEIDSTALEQAELEFRKFETQSSLEELAIALGFPNHRTVLEVRSRVGGVTVSGASLVDAFVRITYTDVAASPLGANPGPAAIKQVTYRLTMDRAGTELVGIDPVDKTTTYWPTPPARLVGVSWTADGLAGLHLIAFALGARSPVDLALKCGAYDPVIARGAPVTSGLVELRARPYPEAAFPMRCTVAIRDSAGHSNAAAFTASVMYTGAFFVCWVRDAYFQASAFATAAPRCSGLFRPVGVLKDVPVNEALQLFSPDSSPQPVIATATLRNDSVASSSPTAETRSPLDSILANVGDAAEFDHVTREFDSPAVPVWLAIQKVLSAGKDQVVASDNGSAFIVAEGIHGGIFKKLDRYYIWLERGSPNLVRVHLKLMRYIRDVDTHQFTLREQRDRVKKQAEEFLTKVGAAIGGSQ